jgi:hypothetical protein
LKVAWKRSPAVPLPAPEFVDSDQGVPSAAPLPQSRWTAALFLAGSAVMGATALALWNRRTIISMRAQIEALASERREQEGGGEEIV